MARSFLKSLLLLWMTLVAGLGLARAQTDLITFTGTWSTVPVTGLSSPTGVSGDAAGNLYIADAGGTSVIKLTANGTQSAIGSGLNIPQGITVDAAGNVYVSSSGDNKVYKITSSGIQATVASGWNSPGGVGVDSNGNLYVADQNGLWKVTAGGTKLILVSSANILGVAVDSNGNIYYGDTASTAVFEIPAGGSSPVEHNFSNYPLGLYVDAQGNVFMAETSAGALRSDDNYGDTTIFGNTTVSIAVWGDSSHNLYVADATGSIEKLALGAVDFGSVNACPEGSTVTPCSSSQTLHFALDSDVSASVNTRSVTQGAQAADYATTADTCTGNRGDGSTCTMTLTFSPEGAGTRTGAAQVIGSSVVDDFSPPSGPGHPRTTASTPHTSPQDEPADTTLSNVLLHGIGLAPVGYFDTAPIQTIGFTPLANAYIYGINVAANGDLYITDLDNCVIQKNSGNTTTIFAGTNCGAPAGDGGPATSATFEGPLKTALDGAGNLYIADYIANTVRKVDGRTGIITTFAGTGTQGYTGDGGPATSATFKVIEAVALDPAGNLYIADSDNDVVRKVDATTGIVTTIAGNGSSGYAGDGGSATLAYLNFPDALTVDSAGNLYIADDNNNVIRKVAGGVITNFAGSGSAGQSGDGGPATGAKLNDPEGLAVDAAGNVYIADSGNFLIRKVDVVTGIITTAAGTYNSTNPVGPQYSGDGGPAIEAGLSYLEDVAVDEEGILFIADSDNSVVRVVIGPVGFDIFGSTAINSSSTPKDVTLSNVGTTDLNLTGLQVSTNFNYGGTDTTCTASTSLSPDAECVFGIIFAPTAAGPLNGGLGIADNFENLPTGSQTIILSGTGGAAATATQLAFAGPIPPVLVGGNVGTIAVDLEGSNGSVVTTASSNVTLTISGPGGYPRTVVVAAVNGIASFNLSALPLNAAGVYTLVATSPGLTQAVNMVTVAATAAAPAQLAISSTISATIPAGGSPGIVPVDIETSEGAVDSSATNSVTLTITGPGGYSDLITIAAVSGVANFDLRSLGLTAPGAYTLTATSPGLNQAHASVTVTPSTASTPSKLSIPSAPATIAAGGNLGIVPVDIENSSGAIITTATNTVTLTITGPNGYSHVLTIAAVDGVATFDLRSLVLNAPGAYTLTATSGNLTESLTSVTASVDFTIAVTKGTPSASLPLPPGLPATFSFTLAPASGTFPSPITLSASGLPSGGTYTFSPATVTPESSAAATSMTIQTVATSASLDRQNSRWRMTGWAPVALGLLLLPLSAGRRMRRVFGRSLLMPLALLLLALGTITGLSGCGTGGFFGQPQQTYTITVTGTSGSISHSATVTLTVQ